jgi:putative ABC transport system permease protein
LLATPLPPPGLLPAVQGVAVGLLLLFGFAVPPLLQLKKVSTLRVLRRELGNPRSGLLGGYLLGFLALAGLMFWVAGEVELGAYVVGGFSVALIVFALIARLAVRLAAALRGGGRSASAAESAGVTVWRVWSGGRAPASSRSSRWRSASWRCCC